MQPSPQDFSLQLQRFLVMMSQIQFATKDNKMVMNESIINPRFYGEAIYLEGFFFAKTKKTC